MTALNTFVLNYIPNQLRLTRDFTGSTGWVHLSNLLLTRLENDGIFAKVEDDVTVDDNYFIDLPEDCRLIDRIYLKGDEGCRYEFEITNGKIKLFDYIEEGVSLTIVYHALYTRLEDYDDEIPIDDKLSEVFALGLCHLASPIGSKERSAYFSEYGFMLDAIKREIFTPTPDQARPINRDIPGFEDLEEEKVLPISEEEEEEEEEV
jgi:hypothetical protein